MSCSEEVGLERSSFGEQSRSTFLGSSLASTSRSLFGSVSTQATNVSQSNAQGSIALGNASARTLAAAPSRRTPPSWPRPSSRRGAETGEEVPHPAVRADFASFIAVRPLCIRFESFTNQPSKKERSLQYFGSPYFAFASALCYGPPLARGSMDCTHTTHTVLGASILSKQSLHIPLNPRDQSASKPSQVLPNPHRRLRMSKPGPSHPAKLQVNQRRASHVPPRTHVRPLASPSVHTPTPSRADPIQTPALVTGLVRWENRAGRSRRRPGRFSLTPCRRRRLRRPRREGWHADNNGSGRPWC